MNRREFIRNLSVGAAAIQLRPVLGAATFTPYQTNLYPPLPTEPLDLDWIFEQLYRLKSDGTYDRNA